MQISNTNLQRMGSVARVNLKGLSPINNRLLWGRKEGKLEHFQSKYLDALRERRVTHAKGLSETIRLNKALEAEDES